MTTTNSQTIRTLSLTFNLPLYPRQLPHWRGAFIEMGGWENDHFHNHDGDEGYHYRYPLIHYRLHKGKAGVVAFNEGVEALQKVLATSDWHINWQGERQALQIQDLNMREWSLHLLDRPKSYKLFKWIALNNENYQKWRDCQNLAERATLLQNILASQILAFCSSMDYRVPERLEVQLTHIQLMEKVRCYKQEMVAFNVEFETNLDLPVGIGLGRAVSLGFGWTKPVQVKKKTRKAQIQVREDKLVE